jgi:hypothetical protein
VVSYSKGRITFGPKREEVSGDWRRLHNEELHNLYASPNIIKGHADHVARTGDINEYMTLIRKPEGKRLI